MGVVRVERTDILIPVSSEKDSEQLEVDRRRIYRGLSELDIGAAFRWEGKRSRVGLDVAAAVIERLPSAKTGRPCPPDLIFVESSLLPESVRLHDKLRDFVLLQIRTGSPLVGSWKQVARTYETLYPALHEAERTVYYIPRFFLEPITMSMPWSEYVAGASGGFDPGQDVVAIRECMARNRGEATANVKHWVEEAANGRRAYDTWYRTADLDTKRERRQEVSLTQEHEFKQTVALFHTLFHEDALSGYARSYLWCIPLVGGSPYSKETDEAGTLLGPLGAVFVISAYRDRGNELDEGSVTEIGRSLSYLMKDAFASFLYASARENLSQSLRYARRSAVAAVSGRNMSHNIGSHVLANVTAETLRADPEAGALLLQYLQRRMDFIAHVATSTPSWCVAMPIIEILGEFFKNKLLLDNIVNFAGIQRDRIEFHLAANDDEMKVWSGLPKIAMTSALGKLQLDIAHGAVGAHAFYSVLENLLRNAVKHGDADWLRRVHDCEQAAMDPVTERPGPAKLCLSFRFRIDDPKRKDCVSLVITDHVPTAARTVVSRLDAPDVIDTAEYLQHCINMPIIDDHSGELARGGWGLKEIRVGASFLRLLDISEAAAATERTVDVSWAKCWDETSTNGTTKSLGCLAYTLYLPRTKIAFMVGLACAAEQRSDWEVAGFQFIESPQHLLQAVRRSDVLTHAFLVLHAPSLTLNTYRALLQIRGRLPTRILLAGEVPKAVAEADPPWTSVAAPMMIPAWDEITPVELEVTLWESWTSHRFPDDRIVLRWFDQEKQEWPSDVQICKTPATGGGNTIPLPIEDPHALVFDHNPEAEMTLGRITYHHAIAGGTGMASLLLASRASLARRKEIVESAAGRVAILDERSYPDGGQQAKGEAGLYKYKYADGLTISQAWRLRRVTLLDSQPAFEDFGRFVDSLPEQLGKAAGDGTLCDFFVVHQGVLDEIRKRQLDGLGNPWQRLKTLTRFMVVDTGRGMPAMAFDECLAWVEYSNLEAYVRDRPGDKIALWKLLNALRASPDAVPADIDVE